MRQFMSGMKNYLVKHGEGDFQREVLRARSMLKPDEFLNLDTILENVMHQLVVLPLREHLYGLFVDYYTGTGDIQLLVANVKHAFGTTPVDFGIRVSNILSNAMREKKKKRQNNNILFFCYFSHVFNHRQHQLCNKFLC